MGSSVHTTSPVPRNKKAADRMAANYRKTFGIPLTPRCRVCRCTEDNACAGGCSWVQDPDEDHPLCSTCYAAARGIADWLTDAVRPSWAALRREAEQTAMGANAMKSTARDASPAGATTPQTQQPPEAETSVK